MIDLFRLDSKLPSAVVQVKEDDVAWMEVTEEGIKLRVMDRGSPVKEGIIRQQEVANYKYTELQGRLHSKLHITVKPEWLCFHI